MMKNTDLYLSHRKVKIRATFKFRGELIKEFESGSPFDIDEDVEDMEGKIMDEILKNSEISYVQVENIGWREIK